jgi:hypothetical protein
MLGALMAGMQTSATIIPDITNPFGIGKLRLELIMAEKPNSLVA